MTRWLPALLCFLATLAQAQSLPLNRIKLPPGFEISVLARNLPSARSLALSPGNVLYVGSQRDRVYAVKLQGEGEDVRAGETFTVASGLNVPNGVALRDGALYIAEINRILKIEDVERRLSAPPKPTV